MDDWGWEQMRTWLADRVSMPVGPLFCVIDGPTRGKPWAAPAVGLQLHRLAAEAGARRRFAPHQLRHAHAVEMAREGVPLNVIQRQLGHANLRITEGVARTAGMVAAASSRGHAAGTRQYVRRPYTTSRALATLRTEAYRCRARA